MLLVGGIVAVVVVRREPPAAEEPAAVRPLKTMVVGQATKSITSDFPGQVAAGEEVAMAFEYGGTLTELPVKEGDRVKKGQVLAGLDPRDAQNQLDAAKAELKRAEAQRTGCGLPPSRRRSRSRRSATPKPRTTLRLPSGISGRKPWTTRS